ncbi:adenine deaminase [Ilyomonas limi]|uniref:Adenine deaminase n=1 Tax=Ilyomonas limi TaxID=2575867 RepID=A0A4V5UU00_9BACT|nr:adenine deaminase [Ilyomonas limi]TKK67143.1 adenine deaminase [Ilyomonas limi]
MPASFTITANFVNIFQQQIYPVHLTVENDSIQSITEAKDADATTLPYLLPGFIDSHVHIESSMLVPQQFARLAVVHGTVATVSDPHEIANVCGMAGVDYMIEDGKKVPFKFYFGAPSCVPATVYETAGALLDSKDVKALLLRNEIHYLSEMMNFPGVLHKDEKVMQKIAAAKALNKPVDGHAPGLRGDQAKQYIDAGISTDHECFTIEEATDKLQYGMKIIIREGSAARNFEVLVPLLNEHYNNIMFCSDDKHPDSLVQGHINILCARAVAKGIDVFKVLQAACINPVVHYALDVGLLREGDKADFIIVNNLKVFEATATYINGQKVAEGGKSLITTTTSEVINNFSCKPIDIAALQMHANNYINNDGLIPVIEALDGELITNKRWLSPKTENNLLISDTETDVLKMAVVNRYRDAPAATCFIKNFGLRKGAIASSVAHDSHNIIAVGVSDEDLLHAINIIIKNKGGISCVDGNEQMVLPLPVAGLMSTSDGYIVAENYTSITAMAKRLGSPLQAPFMTLSFMALLVIPHLKLSDKGLFDGDTFSFI